MTLGNNPVRCHSPIHTRADVFEKAAKLRAEISKLASAALSNLAEGVNAAEKLHGASESVSLDE